MNIVTFAFPQSCICQPKALQYRQFELKRAHNKQKLYNLKLGNRKILSPMDIYRREAYYIIESRWRDILRVTSESESVS